MKSMLEPTVLVVTTVPDPAGNSGGFFRQYSVALSLGMNLAIGMALFTVLGRYLGRLAGAKTDPLIDNAISQLSSKLQ